ncbi:MAG: bacteriohemerythrin [Burkholderiales bacterium]|nr:bacteriohemerythrin [Burkholderiales bacterium]
MPIAWEPRLDTGIEVIDEQHKRIVNYINQLEAARRSGDRNQVMAVIEELVDYTQSHFGFEEAMMEEAGYEFLKPHQKVHELFIKRVTEFTMRAAKGEDIAEELQHTLTRWLMNHIANEDHNYAEAVKRMVARKQQAAVTTPAAATSKGLFASLLKRFFR